MVDRQLQFGDAQHRSPMPRTASWHNCATKLLYDVRERRCPMASSIAYNRFGLGARPDDRSSGDPKAWLLAQLGRYDPKPAGIAATKGSPEIATALIDYRDDRRVLRRQMAASPPVATPDPTMSGATPGAMAAAPPPMDPQKRALMDARQIAARAIRLDYGRAVAARTDAALVSDAPFVERLVQFWANHFAVSTDKIEIVGLAGPMEFEAIRPHVLGRFADMLNAVERHPAMLLYL
ncbi:MAG: DUF1800 family protein, partial [Sphingomonas sp.]